MAMNEIPFKVPNTREVRAEIPSGENENGDNSQEAAEVDRQIELLKAIRKAVSADPRNVELLNQLGTVAEATGDRDRALWAYKRAIRLEPDSAVTYLHLGRFYRQEGRTKPAIQALQNVLKYATDAGQRQAALEELKNLQNQDADQVDDIYDAAPVSTTLAKAWGDVDLTPAEALFLIDPENSSGRQMMRYTLLDLAIRGVLEMTAAHEVGRGDNFRQAELRPHERLFAKYFSRLDDYVDIDRLTRTALAELNSRYDTFKGNYVLQSLVEKGYMEKEPQRVMGLIPVTRYVPTDKGIRARNKVKRLLKQTDSQVARSLRGDPEQAQDYLREGGPAILLLEEFPVEYFQEWQDTLEQMGFGPTVDRLQDRARQSGRGDLVEDILKNILGE